MKLERFTELLAAYGGSLGRWPENERKGAEALLAESSDARAALAEAGRLDRLLDEAPNPTARLDPAMIAARAVAASQDAAHRRPSRGRLLWFVPSLGGLAAAAVAGFLVGWAGIDDGTTTNAAVDYSAYVASLDLGDGLL